MVVGVAVGKLLHFGAAGVKLQVVFHRKADGPVALVSQ